MDTLTVQAFFDNRWQDIALLTFTGKKDNPWQITGLEYFSDYAIEHLDRDDNRAVSLNHPVGLFFDDHGQPGWMKFIDDIIPSGASRRYWVNLLDIGHQPIDKQNFQLLQKGTMAPVGNLRILESVPPYRPDAETLFFTVQDVINRATDFLEYAQQRGAAAGGATGAGGEAPKLLLRCGAHENIWIDTWQQDNASRDTHYLVKYPRGSRSEVDCNILRAEYHYYHELTAMGFTTIPVNGMRLLEGDHYPSLWLPRFDIGYGVQGQVIRYGLESVYSMLEKGPGSALSQEETLRTLINKILASHMVQVQRRQFDVKAFVIEWVRRDLLNIIFGNSDNHGRNTAFLRNEDGISLAPIYDFAPMKADPEGIPRTMQWSQDIEYGGEYHYPQLARRLNDLVPEQALLKALRETAHQLTGLKDRLRHRGVPAQILNMPSIGFDYIDGKLSRWGLL